MQPVKIDPRNIISATSVQKNWKAVYDKAQKAPQFVTRNNKFELVILSYAEYCQLYQKK
ncbi:hypothetical protein LG542_03370 [Latilactobacillus graminis]|uniref:Prevent-host-death family protein n=2 Tax=Latilactobacillus graminis TaxID=60519 RepID=A0AA89I058_9LACO|nr:hypothetical protein FC90_GL001737 [Latilactobacillus graminis DSM 20719]QFP79326.1 hypothetical protein LG542_03370 [Latilactobacillus graminis]